MTTEIPKIGKAVIVALDGRKVGLTRVPIRRYDWAHTAAHRAAGGHPKEQALLEIRIDGDLVGYASRAHGWGKQAWALDRLEPANRSGVWIGEERVFGRGYVEREKELHTPEQIALKAIALRDDRPGYPRRLMTMAELDKYVASEVEEAAAKKIKDEEDRARWRREAEERKARAIKHRDEVLAGLRDIEARPDLSNLERSALVAAIARYAADRP